jgi:hypothetical protein
MKTMRTAFLALGPVLAVWFLLAGQCLAATPDEDLKPLKSGVTITGVVENDYSDGLLLSTDEGATYLILTPEEITLEAEEAFHKQFRGKQVTLTGNVYRDEDGSLSLFVTSLPLK